MITGMIMSIIGTAAQLYPNGDWTHWYQACVGTIVLLRDPTVQFIDVLHGFG